MFESLKQMKTEFETEILNNLDYSSCDIDKTFFCGDDRLEILGCGFFRTTFVWNKYPMYVVKAQRLHVTKSLSNTDMCIDYGKVESFVYNRAIEKGVEWAFAETHWLGEDECYTYYLMERCDCDEIAISSIVEERLCAEWVEDIYDPADDVTKEDLVSYYYDNIGEGGSQPEDCIAYAIGVWNEEGHDGYEVEAFLEELNINDLHAGNWGYRPGTKELVMVDYGGYNHNIIEEQMSA